MPDIYFVPQTEFSRVQDAGLDTYTRLALLADMCRLNALASVKRAGSGHLGSSFSSLDIVSYLYFHEMNVASLGVNHPDRDIYFSSKGHDVPGFYAVLYALGILPQDKFLNLRRLAGTPGHPTVSVPGVEANSGSLGMGISKARGMAWAKKFMGHSGQVYVMTGDGEWQEGQNFEALQAAAHQHVSNLHVLVDHNKVQSDKLVSEILNIGDLVEKFSSFGWYVARCDGHDMRALERALDRFKLVQDKPKILIADTIKGRGVPFMEHPTALASGSGLYRWHAGAPDDDSYVKGHAALLDSIQLRLDQANIAPLLLELAPPVETTLRSQNELALKDSLGEPVSQNARRAETRMGDTLGEPTSQAARPAPTARVSNEYVVEAFGQALVEIAETRLDLVVLDADLSSDCRLRAFEAKFPERFIENGIAEQDMVSMAGGLARQGLLPVVNSFASFLAARANEQIYNNASEESHIIYAMHYAGVIPAGPGLSHQSIRDISLLGALPDVVILQPCNALETKWALDYCVKQANSTCILRLNIGPSPRALELPSGYEFRQGHGAILANGNDAVLFAYGPVMLHEALLAAELLQASGLGLCVIDMPWLTHVDSEWFARVTGDVSAVFVLEDHAPFGSLGDAVLNRLGESNQCGNKKFQKFAVEGFPMWGTPAEALHYHGLDGDSLATRILRAMDTAHKPNRVQTK